MDQETKDLLLKYLQAGADRIERGSAFVEAEIPLVVTEYLNWYFWGNIFIICILLLLWLTLAACTAATIRFHKEPENNELCLFLFGVTLILAPFALGISCDKLYNCVKVSVAPRVVLLEKIAEIAK